MGFTLFGAKGCGSMAVEALLSVLNLDYELIEHSPFEEGQLEQLLHINPVGQVPALVLPDGQVMCESAAILMYLAERYGADAGWMPAITARERPVLMRWMVFLAANIYSTYVLSDKPSRFHPDPDQHGVMKDLATERRKSLWLIMEQAFKAHESPYLLGDRPTILDLYTAMISLWTPSRVWFDDHCPRLARAAHLLETDLRIREIWMRHEAPI
ncbi:glutathione S-transferase family protein [Woodsholea maritima]|uniref:glutathione S-transferase family protein n=1 Tax=Woodsholea maritima TaxID=240237 RepID=UPI0003A01CDF|nr:glutathione S-transferase family protein [Woodsholea maritima]